MKILFVDDCYRKDTKFLGHGGFCIDAMSLRSLASDFSELKESYGIPDDIELKWSPGKGHYLRTHFEGNRQELYKEAILLLGKHEANVICAVHHLGQCYGIKLHRWTIKRAILWAAKQQFKFLVERFEKPHLQENNDVGMIIADHYGDKKGETAIIEETNLAVIFGTRFQKIQRICMLPLMARSKDCPFLQLADLIIGITVCSLANSEYATNLFHDLALLFLKNTYEDTSAFSSLYSAAVLGFGLKLFPRSFHSLGTSIFEDVDNKYIWTDEGIKNRINDNAQDGGGLL